MAETSHKFYCGLESLRNSCRTPILPRIPLFTWKVKYEVRKLLRLTVHSNISGKHPSPPRSTLTK